MSKAKRKLKKKKIKKLVTQQSSKSILFKTKLQKEEVWTQSEIFRDSA